jgi:hypothetical protein
MLGREVVWEHLLEAREVEILVETQIQTQSLPERALLHWPES